MAFLYRALTFRLAVMTMVALGVFAPGTMPAMSGDGFGLVLCSGKTIPAESWSGNLGSEFDHEEESRISNVCPWAVVASAELALGEIGLGIRSAEGFARQVPTQAAPVQQGIPIFGPWVRGPPVVL